VSESEAPTPHRRRPRYSGKNPVRFEDKYKELNPELHAETIAKVRASGKTPAGQHVPILLKEIMAILAPQPGERAVDCTLGYGGHASALLKAVQPGGTLLALDQDPIEIVRTEARLRAGGCEESALVVKRMNFAGLPVRSPNSAGAMAWTCCWPISAAPRCSSTIPPAVSASNTTARSTCA
jgi:16S rRNA (cytosine1402-N4)-methyltransferase